MALEADTPWPPLRPESLERWQGRVDSFVENADKRINTLFRQDELADKEIQQVDKELNDKIQDTARDLATRIQTVSDRLTAISPKIAIIVGVASLLGTFLSSVFITVIFRVWFK
jgi:hypothetical protein